MTLIATTYKNNEREKTCKIINMIRVKGEKRIPFYLIFRLNIVLCDSCQADEIVVEIDEWKQKFQATMSKALVEFFTCIGDINCILKNYYMDFPCDAGV